MYCLQPAEASMLRILLLLLLLLCFLLGHVGINLIRRQALHTRHTSTAADCQPTQPICLGLPHDGVPGQITDRRTHAGFTQAPPWNSHSACTLARKCVCASQANTLRACTGGVPTSKGSVGSMLYFSRNITICAGVRPSKGSSSPEQTRRQHRWQSSKAAAQQT